MKFRHATRKKRYRKPRKTNLEFIKQKRFTDENTVARQQMEFNGESFVCILQGKFGFNVFSADRIQGWAETRWTQLSDLREPLLLRNSSLTVTWRLNSNVYRGMSALEMPLRKFHARWYKLINRGRNGEDFDKTFSESFAKEENSEIPHNDDRGSNLISTVRLKRRAMTTCGNRAHQQHSSRAELCLIS